MVLAAVNAPYTSIGGVIRTGITT